MAVSVTSKGQVTIPKRVRKALGITPGTKVEFDVEGAGARLTVVKVAKPSNLAAGPAILGYTGARIPIGQIDGGVAMRKAAKRARG